MQAQTANDISYHQVNWSEFQEDCPECEEMIAVAHSGLDVRIFPFNQIGDTCKIKICAVFFEKNSWVNKLYANEYLLNHEQRHFDIFEIGARLIRRELVNKTYASFSAFWKDADNLVYKVRKEFVITTTALYDKETNHSANLQQQNIWDQKIQIGLDSLSEYSEEDIIKLIPPIK